MAKEQSVEMMMAIQTARRVALAPIVRSGEEETDVSCQSLPPPPPIPHPMAASLLRSLAQAGRRQMHNGHHISFLGKRARPAGQSSGSGGHAVRAGRRSDSWAHHVGPPWFRAPWFRATYLSLSAYGLAWVCLYERVPITGRRRVALLSPQQEEFIGALSESATKAELDMMPPEARTVRRLRRICKRLIRAADMDHLNWTLNVVQDDETINAFVMPGGKIFVYTGLLKVLQNDDQIAMVLAHEIGHCYAHHQTSGLFARAGTWLMEFCLGMRDGSISHKLFQWVTSLPFYRFSRNLEHEADHIGIMIMARACFDISQGPLAMDKLPDTDLRHDWFSTHPLKADRVQRVRRKLERATTEGIRHHCPHNWLRKMRKQLTIQAIKHREEQQRRIAALRARELEGIAEQQ